MDSHQELLSALKLDDNEKFSAIINNKKGYLSLCYGRFPILSICYLFNSKNIIKDYEQQLITLQSYTIIAEDLELYRQFRKIAGKCLRLYVQDSCIISPLEILALLEDSITLTEIYSSAHKNQQIIQNINTIYKVNHDQIISQSQDSIYIKNKKLPPFQKLIVLTAILVTSIMVLLSSSLWATLHCVLGIGTAKSPYRLSSESQLITALKKGDKDYLLTKDIYLSADWIAKDFSGNLDGNNKTIFLNGTIEGSIINNLTGNIQNIHFVFLQYNKEFSKNTGLVVQYNNGSISNINVKVNGAFTEKAEEEIYISCLVFENNGDITDSSVETDITFTGYGSDNAFLAGLASLNNGNIFNCFTTKDSKLHTDTVDVSGIVSNNEEDGIVKNCTNNAEIKQSSASDSWLPNVSGIVLNNYGEVNNCFNYGNITASSSATQNVLDVYVGGIVCTNDDGFILKSKNHANLEAYSKQYHIYIGGIASVNARMGSTINNCCSYGDIKASSENTTNIFKFGGGICGFNKGKIHNSYSATTLSQPQPNTYLGGISGLTEVIITSTKNNYYVIQENVYYGSAALSRTMGQSITIHDDNIVSEEDLNQGTIKQENLEQLKGKEVYWE